MKNNNTLNEEIFGFLRSKGYEPTMLDTSGKEMPVASEAEVFQFKFKKDGEEYGTVTLSIDNQKLILYCNDKIVNSPSYEKDATDVSWGSFRNQLKRLAFSYGATDIVLRNSDHLKHDMAKRENMKKDNVSEGYYPMGKKSSYNDSVPSVKIVLQHSRSLEEGERRYRAIEKIFIENTQGERFAIPTKKPGLARVYARHIAEGGTPYDEGGKHINSLVEEYTKMAGFVRATKNGTFNESVQSLISEGVNHYQSIRETLHKLAGHRGYHAYFESWSPSLMEDSQDVADLSEMFSNNNLDPRIESAMPILSKLRKKVEEMTEVSELSEWADAIIEGDGGQEAVNPVGIPEESMTEGLEPDKRARLDDLISDYEDATDPSDYSSYNDPEEIIDTIRQEFGDKIASQVEDGSDKMHFPRQGHSTRYDPLSWKKPVDRITKAGKMYKQDSDYLKNTIKARYRNSGKSATEGVAEAGNRPVDRHFPLGTGDTRTARELKTQMQGASDEFVNQTAKEVGPMHSRVAKMQGKLAKSELRRREQGVTEGLLSQSDEFRVELDDGQVHLLDGENTVRISMPLNVWKKMAGKKGRVDEFSVEVDNGQVHVLDGENTVRVSMPVNIWKQLGQQGVAESSERDVYKKAYMDGYNGKSFNSPYKPGSDEDDEYDEGWHDGRLDYEKQGVAEGEVTKKDIEASKKKIDAKRKELEKQGVKKSQLGEPSYYLDAELRKAKKQGVAEGGAKDRQWSNKDMEKLRVATRDFDDIMASDGPEATKQNLIKKRIQTKPMAGPKGVLPEQGGAEGQLNELNRDTVTSYAGRAEKDQDKQFNIIGRGIRDNDPKSANKAGHKFSMRSIGINRAEKRLQKDESVEEGVRGLYHGDKGIRPPESQGERDEIAKDIRQARTTNRADQTTTGYGNRVAPQSGSASSTTSGQVGARKTNASGKTTFSSRSADKKYADYDGKIQTTAGAGKGVMEGQLELDAIKRLLGK